MRQQEVKVQLTLSEGYQERFTRACIKVAKRRTEGGNGGRGRRKDAKKSCGGGIEKAGLTT